MYICIYIYIEREREREMDRWIDRYRYIAQEIDRCSMRSCRGEDSPVPAEKWLNLQALISGTSAQPLGFAIPLGHKMVPTDKITDFRWLGRRKALNLALI